MTQPHLASDDLAIHAAQARIRDNLEARARACFDAALKRPSLGAVDAVRRALMALHHQWVAGLEQEHRADDERDMATGTSAEEIGRRNALIPAEAARQARIVGFGRAQSDFGRNPAPLTINAGQERKPAPCVPRFKETENDI